ncbi:EcsC family protein [Calidifontibacter terrae]
MFGHKNSQKSKAPVKLDSGPLGASALSFADRLITVGIDGKATFDSADKVASAALAKHGGNVDNAIKEIISDHRKLAGASGFVTGLGGFVTMVVALPANVAGFYLLATRMVASIARVRGYDLRNESLRSAILLTLVGADANDLLSKAGVVSTGRLASLATNRLPPPVLIVVNKAVGFRLVGQVGEKFATRLGKAVPLAGGFIGAGMDVWMLHKIADNALVQFPANRPV